MSVVVGKKKIEFPNSVSWVDGNPKIRRVTDKNRRTKRVRLIVCHTHEGILGRLIAGLGRNTTVDERLAWYQTSTDRNVSWDATMDLNGDLIWQSDPVEEYTWQAGAVNSISMGIEFVQDCVTENGKRVGNLYSGQMDRGVFLIDFMTHVFKIQRAIPWDKVNDCPPKGLISRLSKDLSKDFVGICGHRNLTTQRGPGDPGDHIFYALRDAGYELFDLNLKEDLETWKQRQRDLGFAPKDCDGIPLSDTVAALEAATGFGLWVRRPTDDLIRQLLADAK
jgi:hypothetical protein